MAWLCTVQTDHPNLSIPRGVTTPDRRSTQPEGTPSGYRAAQPPASVLAGLYLFAGGHVVGVPNALRTHGRRL